MRFPRPRTVRTKLTLTTVGVIAAVLLLLCAITDVAARQTLTASIDRDLQDRAEDMARFGGRRGPNGPDNRGPRPPDEPPFPRQDDGRGRNGGDRPPPRRRDPAFTPPHAVMFDGSRAPGPPGPSEPY
ncbi:hypothetical protein EON79_11660, partial [bacterium]